MISWEHGEGFDVIGTDKRFGKYEFMATVTPTRAQVDGDDVFWRGGAEVVAKCWLPAEKGSIEIAHLLTFPVDGIGKTSECEHCKGVGRYVTIPGDVAADCPFCGGSGRDVVAQGQRLAELLWEMTRRLVEMRLGIEKDGGGA